MAQTPLVVGHHAPDEGSIDGRSAEEHGMVGYRDVGAANLSLPSEGGCGKRKVGNRV